MLEMVKLHSLLKHRNIKIYKFTPKQNIAGNIHIENIIKIKICPVFVVHYTLYSQNFVDPYP